MIYNYANTDEDLGALPIFGAKLGADAIVGIASTLLPGLLKSKYAESDAAIKQVTTLSTNTSGSLNEINALTGQIGKAYRSTIDATIAKRDALKSVESGDSDNKQIKNVVIATGVITVATIIIDRFL